MDFLRRCFEWHPCDRMTPIEALHHEWILEGLPEKVLQHHLKMFQFNPKGSAKKQPRTLQDISSQKEDNKIISKATLTDIQGFPPDAQAKSIYEIVNEIRVEEHEMDRKRKQRLKQLQ